MSLRRRTQPQTGPWTPSRLGGAIQLWLDATDSTTLTTTSSSVTQWRDKSGYGNNASQATAALQPTLTSTAINGLPALSFASDQLEIPSLVLTGQGHSFFAAATMTASTSNNGRLLSSRNLGESGDALGATSWTILMRNASAATLNSFYNFAGLTLTSGANITYGTPFIADAEFNAGIRLFVNGIQGGANTATDTVSANLNTTAGVRIGNDMESGSAGQYWNGFIGEIIYGKNLSDAEEQLIRGYLAWKWGTTASLPSDHPYKTNSSLFIIPPYTIPLVSYNFNDSTVADGTSANGGTLTNVGSGGSALNGTIQQCTWQQGYSGRGLGFLRKEVASIAATDRVLIANNSALNLTTGATITCWYKNNATTFDQGILGGLLSGEDDIFSLWARGDGSSTNLYAYVQSQAPVGSPGAVSTNFMAGSVTNIQNWNHYAASYQSAGTSTSGVLRIYINGVLRTTLNSATSAEYYAQGDFSYTGNLRFVSGAPDFGFAPPGYGLDGSLDDVRLYSTVLTQAEIAAIASS